MFHLSPDDQKRVLAQLKRHEGAKRDADGLHIPYRCTAGALTIGYGHNLDANPVPGIGVGSRLNDDQAERLLVADLKDFATALDAALPWARSLDAPRYGVLLNMAYNLGVPGLLTFRPTLDLVRRGDYAAAAARMMRTRWTYQVGDGPGGRWDRAEELSAQMKTGVWQ